MDNTLVQDIKDLINKNDAIGIAVGKNPTVDEMAASLSLYLSLQSINKKVVIASPTEPIVEVSHLVGIDKVKNNLDNNGGDLIVSFPYRTKENGDGEIQKVSYTIDDGFLNIVVKAGESGLTFNDEEVKFRRGGAIPKLLFVIGTARLADLSDLFDPQALKDISVINIDNNQDNQQFGNVVLVSPRLSSLSEQVADLLVLLDLPIDIDIAQNLLSGISVATSNFQKQNTSYLAFEMASVLLKKGASRPVLNRPQVSNDTSRTMTEMTRQVQQPRLDNRGQQPRVQQQQPMQPPIQQQPNSNPFMQQQNVPQRNEQPKQVQKQQQKDPSRKPPPDWLTPKVYRGGSSNI